MQEQIRRNFIFIFIFIFFLVVLQSVHGIASAHSQIHSQIDSQSPNPSPFPKVYVLVPGTLNSLVPGDQLQLPGQTRENPYFSKIILETLREETPFVYVVKDLRWFGDVRLNGEQVLREISQWYLREFPHKEVPITVIAHSAGGMYALWAAHRNQESHQKGTQSFLPIQKIVMISAPLQGAELANLTFSGGRTAQIIQDALAKLGPYFDFRGLLQMTTSRMHSFFGELRLPRGLKVFSLAGRQLRPPLISNPLNSEFLAPPIVATDFLIQRLSDGIVSVDSTHPLDLTLRDSEGGDVPVHWVDQIHPNLDHAEQILDAKYLGLMGIQNLEYVRGQQKELYQALRDLD